MYLCIYLSGCSCVAEVVFSCIHSQPAPYSHPLQEECQKKGHEISWKTKTSLKRCLYGATESGTDKGSKGQRKLEDYFLQ